MADNTIIQQGRFTSDGTAQTLDIRSDVDWVEVINETQWATTQTPGRGVKFEWQRGLSDGHAFEFTKADGADTLQAEKVTSGGFTLLGAGGLEAAVTGTTITKADPPVCTAASHGYSNGDEVRLSTLTNMPQLATVPWTIGSVATNTFELTYMDTNTANFTAEAAFTVRRIKPNTINWTNGWTPIAAVSGGSTTSVVTTSDLTSLTYAVGDVVKFSIPGVFGMVELDGLTGVISSYTAATNTYVVAIDSSAFTSFAWPASSSVPFTHAFMYSAGTETTASTNPVRNLETLSILLGAGVDGPAGSSSDVIYWRAGKSFAVSNA